MKKVPVWTRVHSSVPLFFAGKGREYTVVYPLKLLIKVAVVHRNSYNSVKLFFMC